MLLWVMDICCFKAWMILPQPTDLLTAEKPKSTVYLGYQARNQKVMRFS